MITPTIHLNGSSSDVLIEGYTAAAQAAQRLLEALDACGPNGRDYYHQGPEALGIAQREHAARVAKVREVLADLQALAEHVSAAADARRARRR